MKVDNFVFPADFIVLDREEDEQVPNILGRPLLSTERAFVDIRECKLTLWVGEEAVNFGFYRSILHSRINDDMAFSVDVLDELLEKESWGWKEKETDGLIILEGDFDAKFDIQELEKPLEKTEYNKVIKEVAETPRRNLLIFHD